MRNHRLGLVKPLQTPKILEVSGPPPNPKPPPFCPGRCWKGPAPCILGGPGPLRTGKWLPGPVRGYHFQFLERRLNTFQRPTEAAVARAGEGGSGDPVTFKRGLKAQPPLPRAAASSWTNHILGSALVFGGSLTRARADFFLTDLSLTPN